MNWIEIASKSPILQGVSTQKLLELFGNLQFQLRSFQKDEVIALQGDPVNRLMILLEGSARGEMTNASGQVIKIEDIGVTKSLAGAFLFAPDNRFPVNVFANEPVKILVIYREEFLRLLRMDETIQMNYLTLISSKAEFLTRKIHFLSFKTIKEKLAHYLMELQTSQKEPLTIPVSQQELADLFGVTRPSVARAFGELHRAGIIRLQNRKVEILKSDELEEMTK